MRHSQQVHESHAIVSILPFHGRINFCFIHTVNPLLRPREGLFFQTLLRGGLKERGAYLILRNTSPVAKIPRYTTFPNNKTMMTILHRELERKVEKLKHMKLEVMQLKTKNNMNFQPE